MLPFDRGRGKGGKVVDQVRAVTPQGVRASFDLTDAVALVTGGGTGLGRAIAVGLAELGARVAVAGRRADVLQEATRELEESGATAVAVEGDVTQPGGASALVRRVVDRLGRLDVLVNSAGTTIVKPSLELTPAEWDRVIDTNLKGLFFTSVEATRQFVAQGTGGAIVNIASVGALRGGAGVYSAYSASKGGVVSLTRSLASEWATYGVRVNCIAAGAFHTEMSAAAYEDPAVHAKYVRRIPLGRTGEPHEIAPLAAYLASPASAFVTGEVMTVDGGQVMR